MTRETGFVEASGARIYYEVEGSAEPVVLIHAGIANLRMWDEQVPALTDAYRVIRYDTRGFGRTETEEVPFSLEQPDRFNALLREWLDAHAGAGAASR